MRYTVCKKLSCRYGRSSNCNYLSSIPVLESYFSQTKKKCGADAIGNLTQHQSIISEFNYAGRGGRTILSHRSRYTPITLHVNGKLYWSNVMVFSTFYELSIGYIFPQHRGNQRRLSAGIGLLALVGALSIHLPSALAQTRSPATGMVAPANGATLEFTSIVKNTDRLFLPEDLRNNPVNGRHSGYCITGYCGDKTYTWDLEDVIRYGVKGVDSGRLVALDLAGLKDSLGKLRKNVEEMGYELSIKKYDDFDSRMIDLDLDDLPDESDYLLFFKDDGSGIVVFENNGRAHIFEYKINYGY